MKVIATFISMLILQLTFATIRPQPVRINAKREKRNSWGMPYIG